MSEQDNKNQYELAKSRVSEVKQAIAKEDGEIGAIKRQINGTKSEMNDINELLKREEPRLKNNNKPSITVDEFIEKRSYYQSWNNGLNSLLRSKQYTA